MQRRKFIIGMAGALAIAATAGIAEASSSGWHYLATKRVGLFVDFDTIHLAGSHKFHKIKLQVTGNGLFMYDLKVTFRNGPPDHIPVRWHIPQGGGTRVIDLQGGDRDIRTVQLFYGKLPNGRGSTYVHLYGRN
jgi:hypothetical protein